MKQLITHEELLKYCTYNAKTGIFTLKRNGARVGHFDKNNGKRAMHINGKKYQETRLAVFYVTGKWPRNYVKNTSRTAQYNTKLRYLGYRNGNNEFVAGTQFGREGYGSDNTKIRRYDPPSQITLWQKVKDLFVFMFWRK